MYSDKTFRVLLALFFVLLSPALLRKSEAPTDPRPAPLPPIRAIASMGVRPPLESRKESRDFEAARARFESLKRNTPHLTNEQVRELQDGLSLTIVAESRHLRMFKTPAIRAILRNDSPHPATFVSGSIVSASGQFPYFTWKVIKPDGSTVFPTPTVGCGNQPPPGWGQFVRLDPGDEMDILTMDIHYPFNTVPYPPGTYSFQLQYSTDPDHPRKSPYFYRDYLREYPELSQRIPNVSVVSNVITLDVVY